jgi:HEPN domain
MGLLGLLPYTSVMDLQNEKPRSAQLKSVVVNSLGKAFPENKELVGNLSAMYDMIARRASVPTDDKTRRLGTDFLCEAIRDIRSCRVLHSRRLYPHSVYHLQQAVEKTVKGYVLLEGYYRAGEFKAISTHQSPLIVLKAMFEKTGVRSLAETSDDRTLITKIMHAESTVAAEKARIEIAGLSQSQIRENLIRIEDYREQVRLTVREVNRGLRDLGFAAMPKSVFQPYLALPAIIMLAIITFPHWSCTRYPDGRMTPSDYSGQLGVVREIPALVGILEKEIRDLQKAYRQQAGYSLGAAKR